MTSGPVVLAGGTGGAKLARGMLDVAGDGLTVIANTADDLEIYGAYVCPDPDLVTFWLADRIDERGWGLSDDTFAVMDGLRELGVDVWFNLGDRDLAIGIERDRRLRQGARLTETLAELGAALGVTARVLPMCDEPVRTWVQAEGGWAPFQEFMIRSGGRHGGGAVDDMRAARRRGSPADPRDPRGAGERDRDRHRPVQPRDLDRPDTRCVRRCATPCSTAPPRSSRSRRSSAASVLKGPTEAFMRWAGFDASTAVDRRLLRGADRRARGRRAG